MWCPFTSNSFPVFIIICSENSSIIVSLFVVHLPICYMKARMYIEQFYILKYTTHLMILFKVMATGWQVLYKLFTGTFLASMSSGVSVVKQCYHQRWWLMSTAYSHGKCEAFCQYHFWSTWHWKICPHLDLYSCTLACHCCSRCLQCRYQQGSHCHQLHLHICWLSELM
jgi:hypothetical protein